MTPYQLEERSTVSERVIVVDVTGELDLTNAREVEDRLEELSDGTGSSLVLDLNRVVFIDSAALHVLFRMARRLGKERFGIVIEPTAAVARTLAIVAIDEVATIVESAGALPVPLSPE